MAEPASEPDLKQQVTVNQPQMMQAEYVRYAARMLTDVGRREAAVTIVLGVSRTSVRR